VIHGSNLNQESKLINNLNSERVINQLSYEPTSRPSARIAVKSIEIAAQSHKRCYGHEL